MSLTNSKPRIVVFLASAGPAGRCPIAPGTCGTLVAVPLSLGLNWLATVSFALSLAVLLACIAAAVRLSGAAATILDKKDPSRVVIDEIAGFLVANFCAPAGIKPLLAAFALFRFFDIAKIFPADRLQKLPGGTGIVLDDVVAGLYTLAVVQLLSRGGWL